MAICIHMASKVILVSAEPVTFTSLPNKRPFQHWNSSSYQSANFIVILYNNELHCSICSFTDPCQMILTEDTKVISSVLCLRSISPYIGHYNLIMTVQ